jgi:protease IV
MSQPTSLPGRLFRFVWNLVVGIYKLFVILFLVLSGVLLWLALRDGPGVKIENNVALVVAPTGVLVDQIDRDPSQAFFEDVAGEATSQSTVRDMTQALENAAGDTRIAFAVLKLDGLQGASLPQLGELAAAMKTFQETGKKIVAYGAWYDQSHYFAASQADEIVMDPYGVVAIEGFSFYTSYFKDALDKLGVKINVFRVGEFKSAVEPFTRNDMSAEARAANLDWLGDLWQDYGQTVAAGRGLPETAASDYVTAFRRRRRRAGAGTQARHPRGNPA